MALLVANPDGKFKIFRFCPQRCEEPITKPAPYVEEDYHGHFYHPDIPTGEFRHFWAYPYIPPHSLHLFYDEGISIDKESLSEELQKLTWDNEPIEI